MRSRPTIRRLLWLVCACFLLTSRLAVAAERTLFVDLDGDGQRDHVTLDLSEPSVLRVWLSATSSTALIHSASPITRVVARDLDGDHRPELIASGDDSSLHVWSKKRRGFRTYHPRRVTPSALAHPRPHTVDDGPNESPAAVQWSCASLLALALSAQPRAPATVAETVVPSGRVSLPSDQRFAPSAPRPPPLAA